MKTLSLTITVLFTVLATLSIAQPNEAKRKVLVVSFIEDNFYSDIYSKEEIAATNEIGKEEVIHLYDEMVAQIFTDISNDEIAYMQCPTHLVGALKQQIQFNQAKHQNMTVIASDVSAVEISQFHQLVSSCDADYVVFVNAYRMLWVGEPQFKLENHIHYSLYNGEKEEITSDVAIFSTPKLVPVAKMEKKCSKKVGKLSNVIAHLD